MMKLGFFSLMIFFGSVRCSNWQVKVYVNPGCTNSCEVFNLLYIRATNGTAFTDTIASASKHFPTPSIIMLQRSKGDDYLTINWDTHTFENISDVTDSYGLSFLNLMEYNDTDDVVNMSAVMNDSSIARSIYMEDFAWNLTTSVRLNSEPYELKEGEIFSAVFTASGADPIFSTDGRVELKVSVSNSNQYNPNMPRLQFIPGLTIQVELALANLHSNFSKARFGLQMVPISNATVTVDQQYRQKVLHSIFDEVTPGTFKTINILLAERVNRHTGRSLSPQPPSELPGFVQMKPVCYTNAEERNVKSSRDVLVDSLQSVLTDVEKKILNQSVLSAFYGDLVWNDTIGYRLQNVSFGTQGDEFYPRSDYLVWSLSLGLGYPPVDSPSTLLIGLVCLAAIIAAASIVIGTTVICVMRRVSRGVEFQPLIESSVTS